MFRGFAERHETTGVGFCCAVIQSLRLSWTWKLTGSLADSGSGWFEVEKQT
jgi:hypothetical protein